MTDKKPLGNYSGELKEISSGDALELFGLKLRNVAGTILNVFTNATTVPRTWTLQDKDYTFAGLDDIPYDGWIAANETWTYLGADSSVSTYTFTISGDKTGKYQAGQRIKLTQTSVKYFIVTKVLYSAPNTIITIFGGTDYSLANTTITNPFYSLQKTPFGFPMDKTKWTVELISTTNYSQANPAVETWYNLGSLNKTMPIGLWNLSVKICYYGMGTATAQYSDILWTLSTSSNSLTDSELSGFSMVGYFSTNNIILSTNFVEKVVNLSSATTYYLLLKTRMTDQASLNIYTGNAYTETSTIIRAVSAYL